ncbi:alpha/beta hydrolase [Paenibacillus sp. TRM 82003]|uniref:alpha/beta hydrolase n=1 Tax=Kineococcus sp. TRM81007 TaxID=2925831 RepID=UPI001F5680D0|nr:alpha/beta hydrolase fold domain-containing protein [Kineococcus sp. TRM81007]MCI2237773.1 alpha/beta hydrolase [Kineococcus sp. TRM81007]MCI3921792.1 alpha/beta hydrolase [Paenibacillus sp. TRM 82003]
MPPLASRVVDADVTGPRGPVPVRCYEPPGAASSTLTPTLVWLHGGAYFAGSLDKPESDALARALAGTGVRVVTVDYPLAPLLSRRWPCPDRSASGVLRERFPAQVHDVAAVLAHVRATCAGPVLLGGASAGACLAAGTAVAASTATSATQDEEPRIDGVVLAYGFFHARLPPRPRALRATLRGRRRFTHTRWPMLAMNLNHTGSRALLRDPSAFPGGHRPAHFPPTLLLDADRDGMRASSSLFAADLAAAGVPLEHQVLPEAVHGFLGRPQERDFTTGVEVIARWSRSLVTAEPVDGAARTG